MSGPIWSRTSHDGLDLVKKLLCFDPDNRITAQASLHHNWIVNNTENIPIDEVMHNDALKNLQ